MSINGHKQKKREWLRYRDFVLSPYSVIKIKSLGYTQNLKQARLARTATVIAEQTRALGYEVERFHPSIKPIVHRFQPLRSACRARVVR
ncbi:hypothetical protein [Symbiopectobacterium sp. RP]|uniref:hypothetical protein n=1 Tax=Symbiopectobacterium sp. RP TaxID=3248553 RepID=UPI003D26F52E